MDGYLMKTDGSVALAPTMEEQLQIIKLHYAPGISDTELKVCVMEAQHRGLDLFKGHCCLVKRWDKARNIMAWKLQPTIDGVRAKAMSQGNICGMYGPEWCGKDGKWVDIWTSDEPPFAARFGVKRKGWEEKRWSIAYWKSYCQYNKEGKATEWWFKGGAHMLAKCAESLALRSCEPDILGQVYIREEMMQANALDEGQDIPVIDVAKMRQDKEDEEALDKVCRPPVAVVAGDSPEAPVSSPTPTEEPPAPVARPQPPPTQPTPVGNAGKGNRAPFWAKAWVKDGRTTRYIFAREGEHFSREWLIDHGFEPGMKAWKRYYDDAVFKQCEEIVRKDAEDKAPLAPPLGSPDSEWHPSALDIELLSSKADKLGLTEIQRGALIEMIPPERRGDPKKWTRKDYDKLMKLLTAEEKERE